MADSPYMPQPDRMGSAGGGGGGVGAGASVATNTNKGKQLMSFQAYIRTLSNSIDEQTACKKYKDFMASLVQSRVGRFFDANKDKEWFRLRYHPIESKKTTYQQHINFSKRLKIFNDLNESNYFHSLPYTAKYSNKILNLLDAITVQLEDGPKELVDLLLQRCDNNSSNDVSILQSNLKDKYIPTKPNSVFIDDLSIDTTIAEIEEICKQASSDILRITELDPYYVKGGHLRRKFVIVYQDTVDIKNVCWNLSRTKLNNRLLNVSINKGISKRIFSTDSTSNHYYSVINDIRNAIKLILNFDELKGLHAKRKQYNQNGEASDPQFKMDTDKMEDVSMDQDDANPANEKTDNDNVAPPSPPGSDSSLKDDEEKSFDIATLDEDKEKEKRKLYEFKFDTNISLHRQIVQLKQSKNPILEGAYVYLAEFVENAAISHQLSKVPKELRLDVTDDKLLDINYNDTFSMIELIVKNLTLTLEQSTRYLDKLLWYLRIVHSVDYYNKAHYKHEDDLTIKMSVIHLRDDPAKLPEDLSEDDLRRFIAKVNGEFEAFSLSLGQRYVTKDEERFNYRSYGKVITDELGTYTQRIQKQKSNETEEVYKCKHCSRVFQKLADIGRHFVGKHRWAIDAIELETDFFNAYLFDCSKIDPTPPKELVDSPPNRFAKLENFSQMGEDPDLLQQTIEAYSKMECFVREPAPRAQVESDPRNQLVVSYDDVSFDDAI